MICGMKDVKFTIFEQLGFKNLIKKNKIWKTMWGGSSSELVLNETRKFAAGMLVPSNEVGDKEGVEYCDGKVSVPECYHEIWKIMAEDGYIAMTEDEEFGGMDMPQLLAAGCSEMMVGANFAFMMYPGLAKACGNLLLKYGTKRQKELYVEGLFCGDFGGTMLLTEPDAGSDVGAIKTTAKLHGNDFGKHYQLNGQKIFISNGEHDLTKNIVHPVLARIEGDPEGIKGLSLFLVPKFLLCGTINRINCIGVEEKMGIHGNGTCTMSLDGAYGELIGERGEGIKIMFSLMNEARLMVATQGLSIGSAAYEYALGFAKTRVQGRHFKDFANPEAESVTIINHPDVKKNLMYMKSLTEGMRGLLYYSFNILDRINISKNDEEKEKLKCILDLLTPLLKGYMTEKGVEITNLAMQVYGGAGYTKEYPIEQLVRDARITTIYEGTTGIQALTLIARNLFLKKGAVLFDLLIEIEDTLTEAGITEDDVFYKEFRESLDFITGLIMLIGEFLKKGKIESVLTYATETMMCFGNLLIAWQLLWKNGINEKAYFDVTKYFITHELKKTNGNISTIIDNIKNQETIKIEAF